MKNLTDFRKTVETGVDQRLKLSFPTQSTTDNWTTKSWHFIYRLQ